jgi:pimeloyl-ACP methyl ester carboxylesterase
MATHTARVDWEPGLVTSRDGTAVSYLSTGRGPGLVVVPGNNRRAHHYSALATELSVGYSVHVLDRRGRGLIGPQGPGYSVEREIEDVEAVLERTGARTVFGHSYGGLVALHLALRRDLGALVVYEPGVSIDGSFGGAWLPEFTRLLDEGRGTAAMAVFLKRTRLSPLGNAPMPVFRALAYLMLRGSDGAQTRAMMPTTPAEIGEVVRLDSDGGRYAGIGSPTLLLGGRRSPRYITGVLPQLIHVIPAARCRILDGLDHNAPDLNAPAVIARQIMTFRPAGAPGRM